ncbi:MAG: aminopeptidase [Planctomycetes bacterium]|nr:aminopeptidase [Planctomycetota bacterium]
MPDPRYEKLADVLINHSTALQAGENVLIEVFDAPSEIVIALIKATRAVGGNAHVAIRDNRIMRALNYDASNANFEVWADYDRYRMTKMQAYIGLRGSQNVSEAADIPDEQQKMQASLYAKPVHFQQRVCHTRWCVLRWPTPSMAQLAQMSTEAFEDFYFNVCTLDYAKMASAIQPLEDRMSSTDQVRINGPGDTDLTFSIRDINVIGCSGTHNIPDGEIFTAPVRDSINGIIHYNTPTIYNGASFENVRLTFENGRVVEASAEADTDKLNSILDTDDGARYVGEFAIGFNPYITHAMKDILFDEKIAGSLHFTPGRCYEEADNGNKSEIHWDLVLIQRPEFGGGTIHFDGELIRRDGLFIPGDLEPLNPDALKG